MVTKSGDPKTKANQPTKNIVLIVIETIIVFQMHQKQRDEECQRYIN